MSTEPLWSKEIAVEEVGGVPFRMYTDRPRRVEQLLGLAERWGARVHLIQGERQVSFAGLGRGAADKARQLAAIGVGPGDRVMLFGWNSPDFVMNFWAAIEVGAIPVLANAWWGENEVRYGLELIQPKLVLADAATEGKIPKPWRLGPWAADENAAAVAGRPIPSLGATPAGEQETAVIVFTSGTEGRAKAVVLPHRALLSGLQMMLHITRLLPLECDLARPYEIALHTGPLFHVGGPQVMLRSLACGNTLVFPGGRFEPAEVLALVERHKVTRWTAVPTTVSRTIDHPDINTRDLRTLRAIGMGGAPVSPDLLERLRTAVPGVQLSVAIGYGLTENTGPATTASGADTAKYPGTSGRPLPLVEIKIVPREGLPDGEILVRSPTQMSGYYGMAQTMLDSEGWLHTGDLGKTDEGGRLWITGRSKDIIIRGGENIAPAAVEKALTALPQIAEAAVIGVPHPDLGEEVMAFVVLKQPATVAELKDQLRGSLASFAVPTRWSLESEPLPTNQTGKVDKSALVARARAAMAAN